MKETKEIPLVAEQRRQAILRLVEEHGSIRISNLGRQFNVTDMTIRRDIDALSRRGFVRRVHGGAISEIEGGIDLATTFLKRNEEFRAEKERIGIKAQEFVEDNSTIIIDGGSTNEYFARRLDPKKRLHVITHGLNIAWIVSANENHELFIPGGLLNRLTMTLSGNEVVSAYEELNADALFLSASGVSVEKGLTDPAWLDVSIKKAMIKSSRRVILLIDSHKFDLVSPRTFAALDEVDCIVTDGALGPEIRAKYERGDLKLVEA